MKTIIHDFNKETFSAFELPDENVVVLNADGHYAPCRGCFACWLKNTGFCVMDDSLKHAGALIGHGDPLIIISRLCYGGPTPAAGESGRERPAGHAAFATGILDELPRLTAVRPAQ